MTHLKEGHKAPDFKLDADNGETLTLKDFKGRKLVLYFYPKDDTSGCTAQACAFNESLPVFEKMDAVVLGVSRDSLKSHEKFSQKYNLTFPLLADEDGAVCAAYGVWVEKSMYGRKYMGIERTTFLIDQKGVIAKIWPKVKVPGHAEDVLKSVKAL
jgi:peroxiredoxin Q/BCP